MKLHYMGKYDMNPESLPCKTHQPDAVAFKEAKDPKTMGIIANVLSLFITILLVGVVFLKVILSLPEAQHTLKYVIVTMFGSFYGLFIAFLLPLGCLFPHELLHAVCFKSDCYLYTNLRNGLLFVVGPETMSKNRFIFLSLLPNIVLGLIPYLIGIVFPSIPILGIFGAILLGMGAGDYYNVFNAITQMPKGSRTYLYQFNSYWYMPEK